MQISSLSQAKRQLSEGDRLKVSIYASSDVVREIGTFKGFDEKGALNVELDRGDKIKINPEEDKIEKIWW
jgi:hypothetical protein